MTTPCPAPLGLAANSVPAASPHSHRHRAAGANRDNGFPFRHDSYFYYLTGFTEPQALLVLTG